MSKRPDAPTLAPAGTEAHLLDLRSTAGSCFGRFILFSHGSKTSRVKGQAGREGCFLRSPPEPTTGPQRRLESASSPVRPNQTKDARLQRPPASQRSWYCDQLREVASVVSSHNPPRMVQGLPSWWIDQRRTTTCGGQSRRFPGEECSQFLTCGAMHHEIVEDRIWRKTNDLVGRSINHPYVDRSFLDQKIENRSCGWTGNVTCRGSSICQRQRAAKSLEVPRRGPATAAKSRLVSQFRMRKAKLQDHAGRKGDLVPVLLDRIMIWSILLQPIQRRRRREPRHLPHLAHRLGAPRQTQFHKDMVHVVFDSSHTQSEFPCNLLIGETTPNQMKDFSFSSGQRLLRATLRRNTKQSAKKASRNLRTARQTPGHNIKQGCAKVIH